MSDIRRGSRIIGRHSVSFGVRMVRYSTVSFRYDTVPDGNAPSEVLGDSSNCAQHLVRTGNCFRVSTH